MNSVHSDARIDPASLTRHVGLEDVRGGRGRTPEVQAPEATPASSPQAGPTVDFGEVLLGADAWSDIPTGGRMLAVDRGLQVQLGMLDLSQAADAAAGAIADAIA